MLEIQRIRDLRDEGEEREATSTNKKYNVANEMGQKVIHRGRNKAEILAIEHLPSAVYSPATENMMLGGDPIEVTDESEWDIDWVAEFLRTEGID